MHKTAYTFWSVVLGMIMIACNGAPPIMPTAAAPTTTLPAPLREATTPPPAAYPPPVTGTAATAYPPPPTSAALPESYPAEAPSLTPTLDPLIRRPLPYQFTGDIAPNACDELSGVVYHPGRRTLFVVDDRRTVCELDAATGELLEEDRVTNGDLEGITVDPGSGLLYLAVEGEEEILEVDPDSLKIERHFELDRDFDDETVLDSGGQGIEGIVFVSDPTHPQGGSFFLTNQSNDNDDPEDQSAVFEIVLPLREETDDKVDDIAIAAYFPQEWVDLAEVTYDPGRDLLIVISDDEDTLLEMTREGAITAVFALPGADQEGIAYGPDGTLYIAQDSGGLLVYVPTE